MYNQKVESKYINDIFCVKVFDICCYSGYHLEYIISKLSIDTLVLPDDKRKARWIRLEDLNTIIVYMNGGDVRQRRYATILKELYDSIRGAASVSTIDKVYTQLKDDSIQDNDAIDNKADNVIDLTQALLGTETILNPVEFENQAFGTIHVVFIGDEPWFAAKEVAKCLGYTNTNKAILDHVSFDDKREGVPIRYPVGGTQKSIVINESGLYSLTFGSHMPTAKEFKKWVTSEVLPSIRRNGYYTNLEAAWNELTSPDNMIKIATQWKADRDKRMELEAKVEEDKPKVLFAETVADSKGAITVGELSKLIYDKHGIDIGRNRLYEWLRTNGILTYQDNLPYQKYMKKGWFVLTEKCIPESDSVYIQLRITGAGQVALVDKIVSDFMCKEVSTI